MKYIIISLTIIMLTFLYNELLIYYHTLSNCNWLKKSDDSNRLINLMLIADTHLLGSRNGHWFDKLRREWQQHRAFQTSRFYLEPDYIVIMGDVTDEGKWCSDREWKYYENRVHELFYTNGNKKTELIVIAGNHDVGFHYDMIDRKIRRFNDTFKGQLVTLYYPKQRNDVVFLNLNSMALENDGCKFCRRAQIQLKNINTTLECLQLKDGMREIPKKCLRKEEIKSHVYSKPIIFTHFPLYRESDDICPKEIDSESIVLNNPVNKENKFKERMDCLSKNSTKQLLELTNPRLVFNGHTHYSCFNTKHGVPEFTIASFSWRNINTPSMLLVQLNKNEHFIQKCYLPKETDVISIYLLCLVLNISLILYKVIKFFRNHHKSRLNEKIAKD